MTAHSPVDTTDCGGRLQAAQGRLKPAPTYVSLIAERHRGIDAGGAKGWRGRRESGSQCEDNRH